MRKWILLLITILSLCSSAARADAFDDVVEAYNNDDYVLVLEILRPLAAQGVAEAQYQLGFIYHMGKGVAQEYQEAAKWYRLAANQGHAVAQNNLGWLYNEGNGVTQDYQEAAKWYNLAAKQGHTAAQNNLGAMYSRLGMEI